MALSIEKLLNEDRIDGENLIQFLLYMPFGFVLVGLRICLAFILWVASIILPNKFAVRQFLSTLACWTFGVYVKVKGKRDPRCSVLVGNYVSCLDSLAASHTLGTISLRKWKLPPYFSSALGIKNMTQFVKKQHFTEGASKPILLQPEGGPTNGKGLLKFTEWPFPVGDRVQPVAISVERPFTRVTVQRAGSGREVDGCAFPWRDAFWFLAAPCSVYTLKLLPAQEKLDDSETAFGDRIRQVIAEALQVETTEFGWEELRRAPPRRRRAPAGAGAGAVAGAGAGARAAAGAGEVARRARQVKEVLPLVPMPDIIRDLEITKSVDVTITNFLEGLTPYTPEIEVKPEPQPSTSQAKPKYVTPVPTGTFPKSAKERELSFQEKKAQMIAEARQRYIEKHGLNIVANC